MARRHSKPLSAIVAQTKRVAQKAAMNRGVAYCASCGWGWETRESENCPNCGAAVGKDN